MAQAVQAVVAQPEAAMSLLNVIERASRDSSVDVAKLESLLQMQERVMRARAKQEFTQALSAVAAELEPVARDARNTHTNTRYAKLESIDAALRPIYSRHGFSVRYGSEPAADGLVHVTCTVSHIGGHSETLGLAAPVDAVGTGGKTSKTGVQAIGSTVTYLRRYLLTMAMNVTFIDDDDDDDGEAARRSGSTRTAGPDPKAVAWKDKVVALLGQAQSDAAISKLRKEIAGNYGACRTAWPDMAAEIDSAERDARERIRAAATSDGWDTTPGDDPIAELIAEVEAMDSDALDGLTSNAAWRAKTRDLFPLDAERLEDAINLRRTTLREQEAK
jgi:hypothetical protein